MEILGSWGNTVKPLLEKILSKGGQTGKSLGRFGYFLMFLNVLTAKGVIQKGNKR